MSAGVRGVLVLLGDPGQAMLMERELSASLGSSATVLRPPPPLLGSDFWERPGDAAGWWREYVAETAAMLAVVTEPLGALERLAPGGFRQWFVWCRNAAEASRLFGVAVTPLVARSIPRLARSLTEALGCSVDAIDRDGARGDGADDNEAAVTPAPLASAPAARAPVPSPGSAPEFEASSTSSDALPNGGGRGVPGGGASRDARTAPFAATVGPRRKSARLPAAPPPPSSAPEEGPRGQNARNRPLPSAPDGSPTTVDGPAATLAEDRTPEPVRAAPVNQAGSEARRQDAAAISGRGAADAATTSERGAQDARAAWGRGVGSATGAAAAVAARTSALSTRVAPARPAVAGDRRPAGDTHAGAAPPRHRLNGIVDAARQLVTRPALRTPDPAVLGHQLVAAHSTVVVVPQRKGGAGKTAAAIGIAAVGAEAVEPLGMSAALVDANLTNPDARTKLSIPPQATTVRDLVDALASGAPPPEGWSAAGTQLRTYTEPRETTAYTRAEIDRLARHLRTRHPLTVVDCPNALPGEGETASSALASWLGNADVLVVPLDTDAASFIGAGEVLDAVEEMSDETPGARSPGVVVAILVPRVGAELPAILIEMVEHLRAHGATIVEVPFSWEVRLAGYRRRSLADPPRDVRRAYQRALQAIVEMRRGQPA